MSQKQQQQREQTTSQEGNRATPPLPQTAVATGHLDALAADLEQIKKKDQLFSLAIAGMAANPSLNGGEKQAAVLIENIVQQSGE